MVGPKELPSYGISVNYSSETFVEGFKKSFKNSESFSSADGKCNLHDFPFPWATLENFISLEHGTGDIHDTNALLDAFESNIRNLPFTRNRSDLFSFNQSCDFVNIGLDKTTDSSNTFNLLLAFREFMLKNVLPWFVKITGIALDPDKIDLTSSIYKKSDYLLCHDDELEGRRIAFIWYLVPSEWDAQQDGGCLELFDCNSKDQMKSEYGEALAPWNPYTKITPKRNCFAFFEVCPRSFHQVCEVLGDRERPSIHGWFHGPSPWGASIKVKPLALPRITPIDVEEETVLKWINPIYLDMNQQAKIRKRFCRSSEIQLVNFLKVKEWNHLRESLCSQPQKNWSHVGPYNHRNYDLLNSEAYETSGTLKELKSLFSSEAFLVILSDLTGIRFHPAALMGEEKTVSDDNGPPAPKRSCPDDDAADEQSSIGSMTEPNIRRLTWGGYTLLGDADMQQNSWRLEVVLHLSGFGKPSSGKTKHDRPAGCWDPSWGGQLVFVAQGEKEDLLTVNPVDNALTLVYTGPGTASFIKYINHQARQVGGTNPDSKETLSLYDLASVYYEHDSEHESNDEDGDDDDDDDDESTALESEESCPDEDDEAISEDDTKSESA